MVSEGSFYAYPRLPEMNTWVLENMELETSLEAKLKNPKLSYLRHIMRKQGFFWKRQ